MPKDWEKYRAEIYRLYIVEEKTVYQVRDTLREQYGFNASVRAYRMHFIEWEMKKYKRTQRRKTALSRHLSLPPNTAAASTTRSMPAKISSSPTPTRHVKTRGEIKPLSQILEHQQESQRTSETLIRVNQTHNDSLEILQVIFQQWQPSFEWSSTIFQRFQDPRFDKWAPQQGSETPAVFKFVDDHIPEKDRFVLVKWLLEADLMTREYHDFYSSSWQESWYHACDAAEWEDARDILYEEGVLSVTVGVFKDCALVVLAERLLEGYMRELNSREIPPLTDDETEAQDEALKRYREILSNFHYAKEDVDPEFYRFVLRYSLCQNIDKVTRLGNDEYRLKYIHLSCPNNAKKLFNQIKRRPFSIGRGSPESSPSSSSSVSFCIDPVVQVQQGLPSTPPIAADSPSRQRTKFWSDPSLDSHTGNPTLDQLRNRWRWLDHFAEYLSNLIRCGQINGDLMVFTPRHAGFLPIENLFDLIYRHVPDEGERFTLTKAILLISSTIVPTIHDISQPTSPSATTPILLQWWANLSNLSDHNLNITVLRTQLLNNPRLEIDLGQVVHTAGARNLFMNAALALLSERFLAILEAGLGVRRNQTHRNDSRVECRQTYMTVMATMIERGIRLDEGWIRALLDSM